MSKGLERRQFLKVLGVGSAGAALSGCDRSTAEKLIPYVVPAEEIVPGIATWYRTTCRECPAGCGMSIRTREGRAIKAEGNPLSPISHGRLCARGQASLHGLYNPDRVPRALARRSSGWDRLTWDEAEQRLLAALEANRGRTVFLTDSWPGTMDRLVDDFCAAFGIERVRYESFALEPVRTAHRMLFGTDAVPVHDFSQADVVLSFGADFLETWGSPVDYAHGWVQTHAYHDGVRGKLVWVGPHQTLTGINADQWLPVPPGTEHLVALAIARLLVEQGGAAGAAAAQLADPAIVDRAVTATGVSRPTLEALAREFGNGGRSLAGGPGVGATHAAATQVALAVALLNRVAGNYGRTVFSDRREEATAGTASYAALQQLLTRMAAGQIGALLVHGPNPAYALPAAAAVAAALDQVPFIASFSPYLDETTERAHLLLPDHHFLESWGDHVPRTGVNALVQPVLTPVFETRQTGDVLLAVARRAGAALPNAAATFYHYLRGRWEREGLLANAGGPSFDENWRQALQAGVVLGSAPATSAAVPTPSAGELPALAPEPVTFPGGGGEESYYLVVYPSARFWDGRLANRPWLQELPDPVSKYSWGSWLEINPATAARLGIDNGHKVTVRTAHGEVTLPAFPFPGIRPDTIAIQLGQGHTGFGPYAQHKGVNALQLLAPETEPLSGALLHVQVRATIEHTGDWARPVQASGRLDDAGRDIAQVVSIAGARRADQARGFLSPTGETTAATAAAAPRPAPEGAVPVAAAAEEEPAAHEGGGGHEAAAVHPNDAVVTNLQGTGGWAPATMGAAPQDFPPPGTHYGEYSEQQPRWAMAIDTDRCIGCSACMVACQAENNIPVVGPENVVKGRLMQWLRIERYWPDPANPEQASFLPMLCQHCNNAPCEPVCPVYAAYHTPDGLNAQVYNRCVGTRYCANNCPYKVRYLNYYTFEWPEPLNWQLNPDVTVREKGVMEKCTMCVQRIRDVQNQARLEGRAAMDGEIEPACAQTCPGDAIVFGNAKDPNSRLRRIMESGRSYRVLEPLNTQPAITYLKRVSLGEAPASSSGEH
ncbi:MAG: 4Fe-4S dicluster domain-containing protein [Gemmatimonadetes bacterium]|nr:4Fe-4S dicluster domain-containing protein [Gemmatimonadota bacterium]